MARQESPCRWQERKPKLGVLYGWLAVGAAIALCIGLVAVVAGAAILVGGHRFLTRRLGGGRPQLFLNAGHSARRTLIVRGE